jgi:hypothetical protein
MNAFVQRHCDSVIGVLSGFDRMLLRGSQRLLSSAKGMMSYLWSKQVLLKDFGSYSEDLTASVRSASEKVAIDAGRPVQYVNDSALRKEDLAREIAVRDKIDSGLVCVLSAVEPCRSYDLRRDSEQKKLVLVSRQRKCLHLYHYLMHPDLGLMHVRLQTWFPFEMKVCLNGRSWLARQMDKEGIDYVQKDNCFTYISDLARAQALMDEQLKTDWPTLMGDLAKKVLPGHQRLLSMEERPLDYYWSADQTEWASDLMFRDAKSLGLIYPRLVRQGILTLGASDVLRFMGKKLDGRFRDSVASDLKERSEGLRLKHHVGPNSVKMYDKQRTVLRVETTVNDPSKFTAYRGTEAQPDKKRWRSQRKGVADLHRRAEVSQACNDRYLSHLATVECPQNAGELLTPLGKAFTKDGRRYRGLRVMEQQDAKLLEAVADGKFAINGFRNGDIRVALFGAAANKAQQRKHAGQTSRRLAMLRAHGLIRRVPRTRRWMLSEQGQRVTTILAATRNASVPDLMKIAA